MERIGKLRGVMLSSMWIFPELLAFLTQHARQRVSDIEWSGVSWTYNLFRAHEIVFGRRFGIKKESSAVFYEGKVYRYAHSLEAALAFIEEGIRSALRVEFVKVRVYVPMLATPMGPIPVSPYLFAIALDTSANNAGGTSGSFSYTCTGSDRALFSLYNGDSAARTAGHTATYNSVSLTKILGQNIAGGNYGMSTFGLLGPASGANTFAYNSGDAGDPVRIMLASYSGVKQTGLPDASAQAAYTASTGQTQSVTTVAANSWIVYGVQVNSAGNIAVTSGATKRQEPVSRTDGWFGDTNGGVSAGSNSASWTWTNGVAGTQAVSFAPVPATVFPDLRLAFM